MFTSTILIVTIFLLKSGTLCKKQPVLLKVDTTAMDSYRRDDKDGICIKKEAGKQGKPQCAGVGSSQLVRSLLSVTSAQCVSSFYIQIVSA